MNVLTPALVAALIPLLGVLLALKVDVRTLRHVGVGVSLGALALSMMATLFRVTGEVVTTVGPLMFHFDQVAASLVIPMTLAMAIVMLATPRQQLTSSCVAHGMGLLSIGMFGVLADNAFTLLCCEMGSALICASMLRGGPQAKGLRRFMGAVVVCWVSALCVLGHLGVVMHPFSALDLGASNEVYLAAVFLGLGSLTRLGVFPLSSWMVGCFEPRRGIEVLLTMVPFAGVAPVIYLLEPMLEVMNPELLHVLIIVVLVASSMGVLLSLVQPHVGRAFGFLLSSVLALIVAGALDTSPISVIGAEVLWASTLLGATGFGLVTAVSMARVGSARIQDMRGLAARAPGLGLFFLILGAAMVGIPGTTSFVGAELILNGSMSHGPVPLILMVSVICAQGLSVIRLFFKVFYGPAQMGSDVPMWLMERERVAFFGVVIVLVLGGIMPRFIPLMM